MAITPRLPYKNTTWCKMISVPRYSDLLIRMHFSTSLTQSVADGTGQFGS